MFDALWPPSQTQHSTRIERTEHFRMVSFCQTLDVSLFTFKLALIAIKHLGEKKGLLLIWMCLLFNLAMPLHVFRSPFAIIPSHTHLFPFFCPNFNFNFVQSNKKLTRHTHTAISFGTEQEKLVAM